MFFQGHCYQLLPVVDQNVLLLAGISDQPKRANSKNSTYNRSCVKSVQLHEENKKLVQVFLKGNLWKKTDRCLVPFDSLKILSNLKKMTSRSEKGQAVDCLPRVNDMPNSTMDQAGLNAKEYTVVSNSKLLRRWLKWFTESFLSPTSIVHSLIFFLFSTKLLRMQHKCTCIFLPKRKGSLITIKAMKTYMQ